MYVCLHGTVRSMVAVVVAAQVSIDVLLSMETARHSVLVAQHDFAEGTGTGNCTHASF